jgi:hypothetical protein
LLDGNKGFKKRYRERQAPTGVNSLLDSPNFDAAAQECKTVLPVLYSEILISENLTPARRRFARQQGCGERMEDSIDGGSGII